MKTSTHTVGLQPCWVSEMDNLLRHRNCVFDLVKCGHFDCFICIIIIIIIPIKCTLMI